MKSATTWSYTIMDWCKRENRKSIKKAPYHDHMGEADESSNIYIDSIQSVTGGTDQTSGECSLGHTIPI